MQISMNDFENRDTRLYCGHFYLVHWIHSSISIWFAYFINYIGIVLRYYWFYKYILKIDLLRSGADEVGLDKIASQLRTLQISGLIVIGGFEVKFEFNYWINRVILLILFICCILTANPICDDTHNRMLKFNMNIWFQLRWGGSHVLCQMNCCCHFHAHHYSPAQPITFFG